MAVRLTILNPANPDDELVRSFVQDRIVIGRARYCDVCLPDMTVSTRHAEIEIRDGDYVIVDQSSLNGTRVAGKKLVPLRPRVLNNGDTIGIAGFELGFRLGVSPGPAEPRDESMRQAVEMLIDVFARSSHAPTRRSLLLIDGPGKASRFDLPEPPATWLIGRAKEAEIRLEDRDVSRRHAEISIGKDGSIHVRDLESRGGVIVNGEQVSEIALEPGMGFKLGNTTLALEHPAEQSLAEIMDAPEELTSSFSPTESAGDESERKAAQPEGEPERDDAAEPPVEEEPPAIGPADPLAHPGQPGYVPTEREIPRPEASGGSDIGLILVGAIIVVAAVVGLVLLFT